MSKLERISVGLEPKEVEFWPDLYIGCRGGRNYLLLRAGDRVFFWADEINAVYVTLCCCDSCRYRQGALPNHPDS